MDECDVEIYHTPEKYQEGVRALLSLGYKIVMFNCMNGVFVVTYSMPQGRKHVEAKKQ